MQIEHSNAAEMMQVSHLHLGYHYDIFWCSRAPQNWRRKRRLPAEQEKLDCTHEFPSYSFPDTSICVNAYFDKITIFTYVIRLESSIGFNNDALLVSLRWRWCNAFRDDSRFIHVHLVLKLHNYQTSRIAAYADDSADARQTNPRWY